MRTYCCGPCVMNSLAWCWIICSDKCRKIWSNIFFYNFSFSSLKGSILMGDSHKRSSLQNDLPCKSVCIHISIILLSLLAKLPTLYLLFAYVYLVAIQTGTKLMDQSDFWGGMKVHKHARTCVNFQSSDFCILIKKKISKFHIWAD